MRIEKKVWPEYFQKILDGKKTFEVRLADWDCNPGDVLVLREYDPESGYTGRKLEVRVTYVTKSNNWKFWSEENIKKYGFQVIGFKPVFQQKVKEFMNVHDLEKDFTVRHRVLDLVSEVGEIAKEILKADSYGRDKMELARVREDLELELGDTFFSLIALANDCKVDLLAALDKAMKKYEGRLKEKGSLDSGH